MDSVLDPFSKIQELIWRRFVVCLSMCHFVLVFFSPFSIAITSLGEERANLGAFRTFVRFVLVWIGRFPLPLGVWEGLRFVIVALPGLFSYIFFLNFLASGPRVKLASCKSALNRFPRPPPPPLPHPLNSWPPPPLPTDPVVY